MQISIKRNAGESLARDSLWLTAYFSFWYCFLLGCGFRFFFSTSFLKAEINFLHFREMMVCAVEVSYTRNLFQFIVVRVKFGCAEEWFISWAGSDWKGFTIFSYWMWATQNPQPYEWIWKKQQQTCVPAVLPAPHKQSSAAFFFPASTTWHDSKPSALSCTESDCTQVFGQAACCLLSWKCLIWCAELGFGAAGAFKCYLPHCVFCTRVTTQGLVCSRLISSWIIPECFKISHERWFPKWIQTVSTSNLLKYLPRNKDRRVWRQFVVSFYVNWIYEISISSC